MVVQRRPLVALSGNTQRGLKAAGSVEGEDESLRSRGWSSDTEGPVPPGLVPGPGGDGQEGGARFWRVSVGDEEKLDVVTGRQRCGCTGG